MNVRKKPTLIPLVAALPPGPATYWDHLRITGSSEEVVGTQVLRMERDGWQMVTLTRLTDDSFVAWVKRLRTRENT